MSRYDTMFAALASRGDGAFIPFLMLGDPDPAASAALLDAAVAGGADAVELGLPFSDPVADGPVIQAAATRALEAGTSIDACWNLIAGLRGRAPALPIGLLVYANLVVRRGLDTFYARAAAAGVDSVLVADVPVDEAAPFAAAAGRAGVAPVLLVPPNADPARIGRIAAAGRGYTYVTTRRGVTGDDGRTDPGLPERIAAIAAAGGPPAVLGFGISTPADVRAAIAAGAAGAIAGSALVRRAAAAPTAPEAVAEVAALTAAMKRATIGARAAGIASGRPTSDL